MSEHIHERCTNFRPLHALNKMRGPPACFFSCARLHAIVTRSDAVSFTKYIRKSPECCVCLHAVFPAIVFGILIVYHVDSHSIQLQLFFFACFLSVLTYVVYFTLDFGLPYASFFMGTVSLRLLILAYILEIFTP